MLERDSLCASLLASMEKVSDKSVLTQTQKRIVAEIRRLHRLGRPLNITAVRRHSPGFLKAAFRDKPFWGWKRALEAADLDYSKIKVQLSEYVKCELCGEVLHSLGKHLRYKHGGLSLSSYKRKFPEADVFAESSVLLDRQDRDGPARETPCVVPHWEPVWSPEYVLDRISEFYRLGLPLNFTGLSRCEPSLYGRAVHYFGTWKTALAAVGIDQGEVGVVAPPRRWTRGSLIGALRQRERAGEQMNWSAVRKSDRSLCTGALKCFGSYDRALIAAGMDPGKIRKAFHRNLYRTKDDVVSAILRLNLAEKPLNSHEMAKGESRDTALMSKARRLFGSWRAAVEAAGLDYERVRKDGKGKGRYGSPQTVIDAIKRRAGEGRSLVTSEIKREDSPDYALPYYAWRHFGSWHAALEAARIEIPPRKSTSKYPGADDVLVEIRRRHEAGIPLHPASLERGQNMDRALFCRASRLFGSLREAVNAAGIDYESVLLPRSRYPTTEAVIAEIRRRSDEGLPLNTKAVLRGDSRDSALINCGTKVFGGWGKAIEAAGLDYDKICLNIPAIKTKKDAIAEIRRRRDEGLPLNVAALTSDPSTRDKLLSRCHRMFGSWEKAIEAAGLDYNDIRKDRCPYRTEDDVLFEIRRRFAQGVSVQTKQIRRGKNSDAALYTCGMRMFGSWEKVLKKAGISLKKVYVSRARYPTKKTVTDELKRRRSLGLPMGSVSVRKADGSDFALYGSALRLFGGWHKALLAAGMDDLVARNAGRKYPTAQSVLDEIRRRHSRGMRLNKTAVQRGEQADAGLHANARHEFGSWQAAIAAADLNVEENPPGGRN